MTIIEKTLDAERKERPKFTRGDTAPDGRIFWHYIKGAEYWVTPEKFQHLRDRAKASRERNLEAAREATRKWYYANREKRRESLREYREKNKGKYLEYRKKLRRSDPNQALRESLRARLYAVFKQRKAIRPSGLGRVLGATLEEAKAHLEAQFQPGMSWENYGQWHVDHIIPLASAKTPEELVTLCHYTNLQPLWAADNIRKGAKIEGCP
jgi:hypothetical protein